MYFWIGILIFLFSVILHEIAHGATADYLGDPTARQAGRLSLNPIRHLDPVGSILLPLMLVIMQSSIILGWAKPVPFNPFNLRDRKYGSAKVAMAGPVANILIAVIFGLLVRFLPMGGSLFSRNLLLMFSYICWINLILAMFNLIPIPPLDGSHILFTFLPPRFDKFKLFLMQYGFFLLIFFIFMFFPIILGPIVSFLFRLIVGIPFV